MELINYFCFLSLLLSWILLLWMIYAFERFCSLFSYIRSFSCSPYTMIDWNRSTIPQVFPGYVQSMSGSHILKDKRGEKTFDAAVYAFGAKTADERDNIRHICRKTFYKGDNKLSFLFCLFWREGQYIVSFGEYARGTWAETAYKRDNILSRLWKETRIKGIYYCPFCYAVFMWSAYKRDNILSLFLCGRMGEMIRWKGQYYVPFSERKAYKGTILLSLSRNMCVRGTLYYPSYYAVFKRIVHEGNNILSLLGKWREMY